MLFRISKRMATQSLGSSIPHSSDPSYTSTVSMARPGGKAVSPYTITVLAIVAPFEELEMRLSMLTGDLVCLTSCCGAVLGPAMLAS